MLLRHPPYFHSKPPKGPLLENALFCGAPDLAPPPANGFPYEAGAGAAAGTGALTGGVDVA